LKKKRNYPANRKKRKYVDVLAHREYPLTHKEIEKVKAIREHIKEMSISFELSDRKKHHEGIDRIKAIYEPYFEKFRNRMSKGVL